MLSGLVVSAAVVLGLVLGVLLYRFIRERQRRSAEYARVQLYETADRPFTYCGTELFPAPAVAEPSEWAPQTPVQTYRYAESAGVCTGGRSTWGSLASGVEENDVDAVQRQIKAELEG